MHIVQFQKIPIPTLRRVTGNSKGEGDLSKKPNFLNKSMKQNWNLQRGGGLKLKNPLWEGYGYVLEQHINCKVICKINVQSVHKTH